MYVCVHMEGCRVLWPMLLHVGIEKHSDTRVLWDGLIEWLDAKPPTVCLPVPASDSSSFLHTTYTIPHHHLCQSNYSGLRYQDLFLEDDNTTKAIHMLTPEEQLARCVPSPSRARLLLYCNFDVPFSCLVTQNVHYA